MAGLVAGHVSYATYMGGGQWLSFLLGPATVAFAIPIYKNGSLLRRYGLEIGTGVLIGSLIALVSSVLPARLLHLSTETVRSLAPRSVTTPIAMDISQSIGGVPTLTAAFVIVTALIGVAAGPLVIRALGIEAPVARGALFGMGAHGIGTARAFESGETEGTVASLAMIGAAAATVAMAPLVIPLIDRLPR